MRGISTLDRLPALAMAALLILAGVGAAYFVEHAPRTERSPFTQVWASYDPVRATELIGYALLGVLIALAAPLGQGVPLASFRKLAMSQLQRLSGLWLAIAAGGLALIIVVKGRYLLYAPDYLLTDAPQTLSSISGLLTPAALVAAGVVSRERPLLGHALLLGLMVCLFAMATRAFAGSLLLFAFGQLLAGRRIGLLRWLATVVATILLLPIPLISRGLPTHGLFAYAAHVPELFNLDYVSSALLIAAENIGFSVPLMIFVADRTRFGFENQLIAMNPAPASMSGWDEIADSMRVHEYIPFSTLGEFAQFGGAALTAAVAILLIGMRLCIIYVARTNSQFMPLWVAGMLGLSLLAVMYVQQYNTRSVSRIVSILILAVITNFLVRRLTARRSATVNAAAAPAMGK